MRALLALCFLITGAHAGAICGDRMEIIRTIAAKYREMPSGFGLSGDHNLVELFTSDKGSWTVLMTTPEGATCIMGTGADWEFLKAVAPGSPS